MTDATRRDFLAAAAALPATALIAGRSLSAAEESGPAPAEAAPTGGGPGTSPENLPEMIEADGSLQLEFGEERLVLPRGLQPSLLCTASAAFVVQAQVPEKTFPTDRMVYFNAMETRVSRDDGKTWEKIPLKPGENGLNMEGGAVQLRDGEIIALDTYITPGKKPGEGFGQLYTSKDDWKTLEGPIDVPFELPGINFHASTDDGGRPHAAQRLHRRILELPNGDLLTTFYGWMQGDDTPCTYIPRMKKTRVMIARSTDRGRSWKYVSTVAVDPAIGTEGFGEPVIARVGKGPHAGRLICHMRTGRELRESISDDDGATWSPHQPRVFAGLDVYRTELWVNRLRHFKDFHGKPLDENNPDELRGAVVDPELIELRGGLLVAAFGVRIPQKLCWQHPEHSWNGNYLAFSSDHGETWPNVVRMTSGVLTTHYMAIEETLTDNRLLVTYDLGGWTKGMRRDVVGRFVEVVTA
ncbi:MAG: sialidase family protein [Planctomycetaceae bacterium]